MEKVRIDKIVCQGSYREVTYSPANLTTREWGGFLHHNYLGNEDFIRFDTTEEVTVTLNPSLWGSVEIHTNKSPIEFEVRAAGGVVGMEQMQSDMIDKLERSPSMVEYRHNIDNGIPITDELLEATMDVMSGKPGAYGKQK